MTEKVPKTQSIEDYATIEAHCEGVPVYAFGYTYVYGVSPDLDPDLKLQKGNDRIWTKIKPKKSWEIKSNKLGSTPAREPKTAANDDQPLLCVHLIDGDGESAWCSRGQTQPDVEPVWIRIDLAVERRVSSVVLVPHKEGMGGGPKWEGLSQVNLVGQAFPKELTIKVSRDAWHWETVYENNSYTPPEDMEPEKFSFPARSVKQVWIIGKNIPMVLNFGHCFSISGVKVLDEKGDNLALLSRGAGVTVSSTHTGYGMDRYTQDMLWPIQYDLGYKWSRVGYDMGMFLWAYVEREKGKLQLDARADEAITEAAQNGVNIIMCLDKGNWLYAPHPKKKDRTRELMETYYDRPPEPIASPEYLKGYLNYVRYMVQHFKNRVRYYEIMNEWHVPAVGTVKKYVELAKATIPVIRKEYPEAKILPVSAGQLDKDFIEGYLKEGLGPMIDVIPWHPFYHIDPEHSHFVGYADEVRKFKELCESYGFKGEYMATEWTWSAPYPTPPWGQKPWAGQGSTKGYSISELIKAKLAAQVTIKHVGLDVISLWNETFQTMLAHWSIGLLRNTFSADPISPTQPEAIYYVQRTLSTVLDDVRPKDFAVEYTNKGARLESWTFEYKNGGRLLAVWAMGRPQDKSKDTETDIIIKGIETERVIGIDILNGREQGLIASKKGDDTVVKEMLIKDFPILVKF